ncbi:hypothetical protein [Halocynthiibacter styelae]|uniref:Uncharacterized protein n=1 Tax=Halocynthiibacter styelae TaxID=2761955 RepID=A0A8J7LQQ2_9RHOB|nr:hypothetical protein [Paenihalocynthiibacter styelae]MBI1495416.1 hypothetical protein [Paenihalocynthiibacter styelae]
MLNPFDRSGFRSFAGGKGPSVGSGQKAAFSPLDIPGLIGWYDASHAESVTVSGSEVTELRNRVPGGAPVVAGPGGGPDYATSEPRANGNPALVWPNSANEKGLVLGFDAPCSEVFAVMCYKDGLDTSFDHWVTFIANLEGIDGNGRRTVGTSGSDVLWSTGSPNKARVNGASPSGTVLPMPLSVVRFSALDHPTPGEPVRIATLGGPNKNDADRAWQGIMCELLAFHASSPPTAAQVQQVETWAKQKYGIL